MGRHASTGGQIISLSHRENVVCQIPYDWLVLVLEEVLVFVEPQQKQTLETRYLKQPITER